MIQFKQAVHKIFHEKYQVAGNIAYRGSNSFESFVLPEHLTPALQAIMLPHYATMDWGVPGSYGGRKKIPKYKYIAFVTFPIREGVSWGRLPVWVRDIITSDREDVARCADGHILFEMEKLI